MKTSRFLLPLAALAAAAQVQAVAVFSDNFDAENGGAEALNYTGFANWTVSNGSVDLIGNGGRFDFLPGNGLYVDMDGSTGDAGKLTSVGLSLDPGDYVLSYDLAGNQRNGSDERVDVAVETGVASAFHSLSEDDPFQTFFLNFSLTSAHTVNLTFEGQGGDKVGMLLDNVLLERRAPDRVPDSGASLALLGLGLLGLAAFRRRLSA